MADADIPQSTIMTSDGTTIKARYIKVPVGENIVYEEMWVELDGERGANLRLSVDLGSIMHGSVLNDRVPIVAKFSNGFGIAGYAKFEYIAVMKGKMILEATELYPASSGALFPEPVTLVAASLLRATP